MPLESAPFPQDSVLRIAIENYTSAAKMTMGKEYSPSIINFGLACDIYRQLSKPTMTDHLACCANLKSLHDCYMYFLEQSQDQETIRELATNAINAMVMSLVIFDSHPFKSDAVNSTYYNQLTDVYIQLVNLTNKFYKKTAIDLQYGYICAVDGLNAVRATAPSIEKRETIKKFKKIVANLEKELDLEGETNIVGSIIDSIRKEFELYKGRVAKEMNTRGGYAQFFPTLEDINVRRLGPESPVSKDALVSPRASGAMYLHYPASAYSNPMFLIPSMGPYGGYVPMGMQPFNIPLNFYPSAPAASPYWPPEYPSAGLAPLGSSGVNAVAPVKSQVHKLSAAGSPRASSDPYISPRSQALQLTPDLRVANLLMSFRMPDSGERLEEGDDDYSASNGAKRVKKSGSQKAPFVEQRFEEGDSEDASDSEREVTKSRSKKTSSLKRHFEKEDSENASDNERNAKKPRNQITRILRPDSPLMTRPRRTPEKNKSGNGRTIKPNKI